MYCAIEGGMEKQQQKVDWNKRKRMRAKEKNDFRHLDWRHHWKVMLESESTLLLFFVFCAPSSDDFKRWRTDCLSISSIEKLIASKSSKSFSFRFSRAHFEKFFVYTQNTEND